MSVTTFLFNVTLPTVCYLQIMANFLHCQWTYM